MSILRYLVPVAGLAAAGAAALAAKHLLKGKEPEHIVGPEAFDDAAEPVTEAAPETAAPAEPEAQPVPEEPAGPEQAAPAEKPAGTYRPVSPEAPNVNPVAPRSAEPPVTEDGKLDVTQLASPEDFADWDDLGCQG